MHNFYLWPCKTPPAAGIPLEDTLSNGGFNGDITGPLALLTLTATPLDGETVSIGGVTYVFQTTLTNENCNVLIGGSAANAATNLIAAINGGAGASTSYASTCAPHPSVVASLGQGTGAVLIEGPPGGIAGDPPLETPPVGKHPTDLPNFLRWWRADQNTSRPPGRTGTYAWGAIAPSTDADSEVLKATENKVLEFERPNLNNHKVQRSDENRSFGIGVSLTMPVHLFIVFGTFSAGSGDRLLDTGSTFHLQMAGSTLGQNDLPNLGLVNLVSVPSNSLLESFWDGTTASFQRVNSGTKSTGTATGISTSLTTIGSTNGLQNHFLADIAEIIIFSGGEVTGQDRTDLVAYLENRYNRTFS